MTRPAEQGFTLVELLVALFVFAVLAMAGVALFGFSVRAQDAAKIRQGEIAAIRRLDAILTADLAQATTRLPRDTTGVAQVAFQGGSAALLFTRRGWDNPEGKPRASVQRVEYRLAGDRIERRAWPMLDGTEAGPPVTIVRGVRALTLRYRDEGEWRARWDPLRPAALPSAVETVVEIEGVGPVRMLFVTGAGQ
ncbi:MAG TPA: type II secretion system minor pseudopilin GspJ [Sphingomonadaceae bacterium]|nr:type II secretion system minor pseudopilin GspJ [Sphingomonadaceae bacterium]